MDFLPSLSLIVTVVVLGLPKVTSDGVPATRANMTLKLSVGSALRQSSTIGIMMLNRTVLAVIVIGWLVAAVKSA